jgi:ribosomal protein S18 acetylase RimI-like enzyme
MLPIILHKQETIAEFLKGDPYLHLYELGDLDDFFWPYTSWIAAQQEGSIQSLILIYSGGGLPVVLAIEEKNKIQLSELLFKAATQPLLPAKFYLHLSPGLAHILVSAGYCMQGHGRYLKMALKDPSRLSQVDIDGVVQLGRDDETALRKMYDLAYPANWFDPRMLETGCFFGIYQNGEIASAAGIHVYSPLYQAAALGNICTHPDYRGRGLASKVTARLCQFLVGMVDTIGLNVKADNKTALSVYIRLGFEPVAEYEEYMVEKG